MTRLIALKASGQQNMHHSMFATQAHMSCSMLCHTDPICSRAMQYAMPHRPTRHAITSHKAKDPLSSPRPRDHSHSPPAKFQRCGQPPHRQIPTVRMRAMRVRDTRVAWGDVWLGRCRPLNTILDTVCFVHMPSLRPPPAPGYPHRESRM